MPVKLQRNDGVEEARGKPGQGITTSAWVDHLLLAVAAEPWLTAKDLAVKFNVHPNYVSMICRTDAFQARLRDMIGDTRALVLEGVTEKITGVTAAALDRLQERVSGPQAAAVKTDELTNIAKMGLRGLGLGNGPGNSTNVSITQVSVSQGHLDEARRRMLEVRERRTSTNEEIPTSHYLLEEE